MVVRRKDMRVELKEKMRGGDGTTTFVHFAEKESMTNARLLAELSLPPGSSIGEHEHLNETEYYIILEGSGCVIDNGVETPVGPGDVVITGGGAKHSIRNTGLNTLRFHAVIVTY